MTTNSKRESLMGRFLTAIGYVCARHESATEAFERLCIESPELFPVPRSDESFWDAVSEVAGETTHEIDLRSPKLRSHAATHGVFEALAWASSLEEHAFQLIENMTGSAVMLEEWS